MTLSIRSKLAILAGVPVVGAAILAGQIVTQAIEQVHLARALGSIESLVELSQLATDVVHQLEAERTSLLIAEGFRFEPLIAAPDRKAQLEGAGQSAREDAKRTDEALTHLTAFLRTKNAADLPPKLAESLSAAQRQLSELGVTRQNLDQKEPSWAASVEYFERVTRSLVGAVSALTELSNDGEMLRILNVLVAALELELRESSERALVAHVLAVGEFPPGSYKKLVTLSAEQSLYSEVLVTAATSNVKALFDGMVTAQDGTSLIQLRTEIMNSGEEGFKHSPEDWLKAGSPRLDALAAFEGRLHQDARRAAENKQKELQNSLVFGVTLAGGIVAFSLILATMLARGITRRLTSMRRVVEDVGEGNLEARVDVTYNDELGNLGGAFNRMIHEINEARVALGEQARMARDLEIATQIQTAMMPRAPSHPEFEFAGNMVPADEVGGDFYDVLTDGKSLWLTIGDVCGHGIGSGLVMVMTQIAFAANFINDPNENPGIVWQRVNRLLCENIKERLRDDRYVTAQVLTYAGSGAFKCAGAHQCPIIYRAKTRTCELYESSGAWLGIVPDLADVPLSDVMLEPGDVLCLYSDGLPEAHDGSEDLYDLERMCTTLAQSLGSHGSLTQAVDDLFASVQAHAGRRDDDWTILLTRRRELAA